MARYGLVVGVAKYKSPLGSLSKPEGDAKAVYDLLKQHGDFEDIQVLTGEVTAKQLEDALGRSRSLSICKRSQVIFGY